MKINVTTSIDHEIWQIAKDNGMSWNDALEFGIKFLLADNDEDLKFDYPKNNLSEKLKNATRLLNEKCMEIERLKDPIDAEKEADELFGGVIDDDTKE